MAIKNFFFFSRAYAQSEHSIQFILADRGVSHTIKVIYSSVISNRITIISSLSCKHLIYFISKQNSPITIVTSTKTGTIKMTL